MAAPARVVLVVEDESVIRMAAAAILQDEGFGVLEAEHADAAKTLLEAQAGDVHVLFTDIHMPGEMNGSQLAHHTSWRWPWIAIIITSGRGTPRWTDLPEGCRYLPKPYQHEHLIEYCRGRSH
jgi:two-component system, response regulator PdtaR